MSIHDDDNTLIVTGPETAAVIAVVKGEGDVAFDPERILATPEWLDNVTRTGDLGLTELTRWRLQNWNVSCVYSDEQSIAVTGDKVQISFYSQAGPCFALIERSQRRSPCCSPCCGYHH